MEAHGQGRDVRARSERRTRCLASSRHRRQERSSRRHDRSKPVDGIVAVRIRRRRRGGRGVVLADAMPITPSACLSSTTSPSFVRRIRGHRGHDPRALTAMAPLHLGLEIYDFVSGRSADCSPSSRRCSSLVGMFGLRFQVAVLRAGRGHPDHSSGRSWRSSCRRSSRRSAAGSDDQPWRRCSFLTGVAFCYSTSSSRVQWIFAQSGETSTGVTPMRRVFQGVDQVAPGFGIAFEVPIVVFYLVYLQHGSVRDAPRTGGR